MGTTYAFLVDCPFIFHEEKKIVLASNIQGALEWMEKHMKAIERYGRIDSIVCVGEVLNG